jgi:protein-L-isoaspartate(D-aspartate) O-methyltransferase
MDTDTITTTMSPEALRAQMVEKIRKVGHAHCADVGRVLRDTPGHESVPDADVAVVYDLWQAVVTHRFEDGRSLSCASAPWVVAAMLDQSKARWFASS